MANDLLLGPARLAAAADLTSLAFGSNESNGYEAELIEAFHAELTFMANSPGQHSWLAEDGRGMISGFLGLRLGDGLAEV
jgi:hypothetical protein